MKSQCYLGTLHSKLYNGWTVDLPTNKVGFLRFNNANKDSWCQKQVGDFVVVKVISLPTSTEKLVNLSGDVSDINSAFSISNLPSKNQLFPVEIISIEDYGWTASLGNLTADHGIKVFVKKHNETTKEYVVGEIALVTCLDYKANQKLLVCSNDSNRFLNYATDITSSSLCAGQLIECKVEEIHEFTENQSDEQGIPHKKKKKNSLCRHESIKIFSQYGFIYFCNFLQLLERVYI